MKRKLPTIHISYSILSTLRFQSLQSQLLHTITQGRLHLSPYYFFQFPLCHFFHASSYNSSPSFMIFCSSSAAAPVPVPMGGPEKQMGKKGIFYSVFHRFGAKIFLQSSILCAYFSRWRCSLIYSASFFIDFLFHLNLRNHHRLYHLTFLSLYLFPLLLFFLFFLLPFPVILIIFFSILSTTFYLFICLFTYLSVFPHSSFFLLLSILYKVTKKVKQPKSNTYGKRQAIHHSSP